MKLTGTPPNPSDLFRHTHQRRKDNTWVDRRSEQVNEEFTRTWEELTQAASSQGTTSPSQLDVWRNVAGVKKGKIYGLGMESIVVGRPYYRGSCSSSSEWVQRQELDELRNQMEEVRTERDQIRMEMANTNKEMKNTKRACERNNKLIKQLMKSIKFQQMPFTGEQANDDDQELDSEGQTDDDDDDVIRS